MKKSALAGRHPVVRRSAAIEDNLKGIGYGG